MITEASPATWVSCHPRRLQRHAPAVTAEHGALLIVDEVMTAFGSAEVVGTESIRCPPTCSRSAR
ncbi:glutamate-1-semialdehyde 2,1-aminomutase domain protein [Mycobacterium xenopi 4042]|uniref:Glutamate-1-semialdehyde 2,1-aminomutase domain protein n=1 Tax=Mycobacterium xenopi 4042 TaxID=1299334 RepID=X8AH40_MYCXE|nr:glutamate-1-semialdehyde 2,1-aminomutase domain protein [Mycobacterium xenopi 4042]